MHAGPNHAAFETGIDHTARRLRAAARARRAYIYRRAGHPAFVQRLFDPSSRS
jgi:hypothetical protein